MTSTAETAGASLVVVSSFDPLSSKVAGLRKLAEQVPLVLAGPGSTEQLAGPVGARRRSRDLVAAAGDVASGR